MIKSFLCLFCFFAASLTSAYDVPSGVVATRGSFSNKVEVSWASVGDNAYYCVYKFVYELGSWYYEQIAITSDLNYSDFNVDLGLFYTYKIRSATSASGAGKSGYSLEARGFAGFSVDQYVPSSPQLVTGGHAPWAGWDFGPPQQLISGYIGDNETSWLEMTVDGSGTLSFEWKQSSEPGCDYLKLYVDGVFVDDFQFSTSDWYSESYELPESGSKVVRWVYAKDFSDSEGDDCAWLRNIVWSVDSTEPVDAPPGVFASDGQYLNMIRCSWVPVLDATHYKLYRASSADGVKTEVTGWITGTTYDDWSVNPGQVYFYFVRAAASSSGSGGSAFSSYDSGFSGRVPDNDNFINAETVDFEFGGSLNSCTMLATFEQAEPVHSASGGLNSVWYSWTASSDEPVSFHALGDTNLLDDAVIIAVYTSDGGGVDSLLPVASASSGGWASISFNAVANTTYYIALANVQYIGSLINLRWQTGDWVCGIPENVVAGDGTWFEGIFISWDAVVGANYYEIWRSSSLRPGTLKTFVGGTTDLEFIDDSGLKLDTPYYYHIRAACDTDGWLAGEFAAPVTGRAGSRPSNDNMVSARQIADCSGSDSGNNLLASLENGEPEYGALSGVDGSIWWRWSAQTNGLHTFDTEGSDISADLVLAVYTNGVEGLELVGINRKLESDFATVTVDAVIGIEYMIAVAHVGGGGGVALNWNPNVPSPDWVDASYGTFFDGVLIQWSAVDGATHYQVSRTDLAGGELMHISEWVASTNFVDWTGNIGQEYLYYVRAAYDAEGWLASAYSIGDLGVTGYWPENDDIANAFVMLGESGSDAESLYWASLESGEPQHGGFSDLTGSLWWRMTAPYNGTAVINTQGGIANVVLAVYTNSPAGMVPVIFDDGRTTQFSSVEFSIQEGGEYLVSLSIRDEYASAPAALNWLLEPDAPSEPPLPTEILAAVIEDGVYRVSFTAQSGAVYEVFASESLGNDAEWQPLTPALAVTAGSDGTVHLEIPMDAGNPRMFYKIISAWK